MKKKTDKIWKNYFDVVILPSKDVTEYSIKLSKDLKKYGTKWALGKKSFIPHISLYHIAVKPKDFKDFVSELEKISKDSTPGFLKTTTIGPNVLMTDKPKWLDELHLKIIKKTVTFYDWDWSTDETWSGTSFIKSGKIFMKKYGTPMMGKNFKPHITLTSFKGEKLATKTKKAKKFKFKPDFLYICELGPSHSCQRLVAKIPLGGARK